MLCPDFVVAFEDYFVLIGYDVVSDYVKDICLKFVMWLIEEMVGVCEEFGI